MPRLSVLSEKHTTPEAQTVPIRKFLLLSPIIHLYSPYVRLPVLITTISSTPQIASNVQSLTNLLVRAEVPPTNGSSIPPIQHGMFRCTSRCVTCQEHMESDSFKSHSTGAHHKIRGHIICTTSNIIYLAGYVVFSISARLRTHLKNVSMVTDPRLIYLC